MFLLPPFFLAVHTTNFGDAGALARAVVNDHDDEAKAVPMCNNENAPTYH